MIKQMFKDKVFISTLLTIGVPVVVQNVISSSLNLLDVVMIGQLGERSISAVGLGNQLFFIFVLLLFGTNSGGAMFVAQFWGKRDLHSIHKTLGVALTISLIGAVVFSVLAIAFPSQVLGLFSKDVGVISLGASYMRIVGWSYLFTAVSFSFAISSRSVGDAKLPMVASVASLITNSILNLVLIFGLLGFPALGVVGAAIATVIARLVEFSIIIGRIFTSDHPLRAKIRDYFDFGRVFAAKILKKSFPVILNEFFWSIGVSLYVAAYARSGTEAYAAVQIAQTVDRIFFVLAFGIGSSAAVMIGNLLGDNKREEAIKYSRYFNMLAVMSGIALGGLLMLTGPLFVKLYNVSDLVRDNAVNIMYVIGFFMTLKICNALQIIGTLRGGGDTTYSLVMEISSVYLIGVPMAFLSTAVWGLPIYICVALVSLEEVTKAVLGFYRLFSDKWANNIIDDLA
ncbi:MULTISPECIES: MATE family efflux transporter [unclassified Fusibacter]|uniref:MATE family efflux transporter n=1 Tax=unclassified Fusibacter TaxID=2624464 RepID=UPI001011C0BD|nr:MULTISPECIES: MATE family efflux transporter [unclassified Fusibacter]MCK8059806.1 MATE family efflux transporter [Fusibacter sp. A2]NPE21607.1 MATE family efflux transporter [Fusibacter sp. A1]RXV62014.1 MATE family efflux transporter [Fusibacter sp. A1]